MRTNWHPSLLVIVDPKSPQSSLVRDPFSRKLIAACTTREAGEAAARLLLWDHDEWYGGPPKKTAYERLRESYASPENTW